MSTPVRSSASALLSAAQIWLTDNVFGSGSEAAAPSPPAASEPATSVSAATVEDPAPESANAALEPSASAPLESTVAIEPPIAVTGATAAAEPKPAEAPERSLAETIASATLPPPPRMWPPRKLSLALQGGGTLSAFTWGVLDRLLEEPGCDFDTISGASAGAVNAALLASGLARSGREEARNRLALFWTRLTEDASFRSLMVIGAYSPASSAVSFGSGLRGGRADPLDLDPLRDILAETIDFDAMHSAAAPRLLISATRVRDGLPQIFRNSEITADVLLASTCPAQLHAAVDIEDESYWDGGHVANPPLIQIAHESSAADLLVVRVTPARDGYVPMSSAAIDRRLDQIAGNAVLNAELAALEWARSDGLHPPRVHRLAAEDEIEALAQRDATDLGSGFIELLYQRGRDAADRWLREAPAGTTLTVQDEQPAVAAEDLRDAALT
ncbi:phospholipase [Bradyrhizobium oligotrophicum S58]|uniref:Phospholipase n=1 Tax=Bradyrhizobium oligotrophicum S58 TaxID=1245469 RepID=M4Z7Z8_9BRAD|nr:patatin-like phospholipase family protein [Bradyrhizobium oligotrophicum]BAM89236.1 phospholipase [Bradyrhizobium oligotrophicum S58]